MSNSTDLVIVGGGLAGGLTALIFKAQNPDRKVTLIEQSDKLGGVHTWTFFESDISPEALEVLKPMISKSWTETEVKFPRLDRTFSGTFHAIRSEDFHKHINEELGKSIRFGTTVTTMTDESVTLEKGKTIDATCVFDARGLDTLPSPQTNGFQKYIGYDFVLDDATPHGLTNPVLVDAVCPQLDGFRYFELLPMDPHRIFVSENFCSDLPELNEDRISKSLRSYVERRGWKIRSMERKEMTVLPMPLTAESIKTSVTGEPLLIGARGGYFHSTTCQSVADTVRFAEHLSKLQELTTGSARESLMRFRRPWLNRQRFYRVVNRLMFIGCEPTLRYQVMQRIFELPLEMVSRFQGGRTSWADRLRVVTAKSPLPFKKAVRHYSERSLQDRVL